MLGTTLWVAQTVARFRLRGLIPRFMVHLWDLFMVFRLINYSGARKMKINKDTTIEDLISTIPESISYLMNQGIKCLACGDPIWGTLESAAKDKGFTDEQISVFVDELNSL